MTAVGALILVSLVLVSTSIWAMYYVTRPPKQNKWLDGTKKDDDE